MTQPVGDKASEACHDTGRPRPLLGALVPVIELLGGPVHDCRCPRTTHKPPTRVGRQHRSRPPQRNDLALEVIEVTLWRR